MPFLRFKISLRKLLKYGIPALEKLRYRQEPITRQFETIIDNYIRPNHLVLDVGCGITTYGKAKGKCQMVIGIDADREIVRNRHVDGIVHADMTCLPFPDNTFDIVTSWTVLEHLDKPQACFDELARVCKPGGLMAHATPNTLHYANFITRTTPYRFHKWFIRQVMGKNDFPYPTRYKINTPGKLRNITANSGFRLQEIRFIDAGPLYLDWLSLAYAIGLVYHHIVSYFKFLSFLRSFMIVVSIRQTSDYAGNGHG
jgi:2-polyprenyl-3-methyl-5-hydroxy-6-metoxy-1,4-benzoquinol methylase